MEDRFLGESFLLQNDIAFHLYHDVAKKCPIIDFHSHLPPSDIATDRRFNNLNELWLEGDHYKWRAMRANGIDEKFITGDASCDEKFYAWASTVPYTLRNPLYHWTHLELRRYFNICDLLSCETAHSIYERANGLLATPEYSTQALLKKMNVEVICTSDDPADNLAFHDQLRINSNGLRMLPTWRPDKILNLANVNDFTEYLDKLGKSANIEIVRFDDLMDAFEIRQDYFHDRGCRLADHGIDYFIDEEISHNELSTIFKKLRSGKEINEAERRGFQAGMIYLLAVMNSNKGWTQQFHVGALRNANVSRKNELGSDTGFDSIGSSQDALQMARFFGKLDYNNQLAPTILYNNNPTDNYMFAAMAGNYQDSDMPGKMQFGAAWWFLDQKDGIEMQINALSNLGLLSRFTGMVTDSRSFLSFPRHEYFRRILCNLIGKEVEEGLLPNDLSLISKMVEDICYNNAKNYFRF